MGALYGIFFLFALLVAIAVVSVIETIALWEKTNSLTSHEEEDVMSVSIGLKIRKRTYLLVIFYVMLRFASIIGELDLISRATSPSTFNSPALLSTDSWEFGLTIYSRALPVYVVLAIFIYFDYYLAQLCIVLSGRRPRFSLKLVRVVLIGAFGLFTLALGNNYAQLWVWPICVMGLVHAIVLANSCLSMHALYSGIAQQLRAKHFTKVVWFVCSQAYCLLLAGSFYSFSALYYTDSPHTFWLTSVPAVLLKHSMLGDPSLSLARAAPKLTDQIYWDMVLCYGFLEALPLLILVASIGAAATATGHSSAGGSGSAEEAARGKSQGPVAPHMTQIGDSPSDMNSSGVLMAPITLSGARSQASRGTADQRVSGYSSIDIVIDRSNRTPTPTVMGSMSFGSSFGTGSAANANVTTNSSGYGNGIGKNGFSRSNSKESNTNGNSKIGTELQPLLI